MNIRKSVVLLLALFGSMFVAPIQAVSFTADAVQVRGANISHAKLFWRDGQVRFEYIEDGIAMAQIFDTKNKKIIWLDNENKMYLEKEMPDSEKMLAEIKNKKTYDPCKQYGQAECIHLKETEINGRKADKWLITMVSSAENNEPRDYHIFQWIDKKYKTILRQENSDGSLLNVEIVDDQVINDRKVRKLNMQAFAASGQKVEGVQWYDNELDIVVRQQYQDDFVDELRNINVINIKEAMFDIPEGYKSYEDSMQTAQQLELMQ